MQTAMRYKGFRWPNNPEQYTLILSRRLGEFALPEAAGFTVQEIGENAAVLQGEGAFYGSDALQTFQMLAAVFREADAGVLVHPAWPGAPAYFEELRLTQEPRENYVAYAFRFREAAQAGISPEEVIPGEVWVQADGAQSLWELAAQYGLSMAALMERNPQLRGTDAPGAGERVRVR